MSSEPTGSTERFGQLAEDYAKHRPDYPATALDLIEAHAGRAGPGRLLVDVGCGTGISSRLFAGRGWPVVGVEPNDATRHRRKFESGSQRLTSLRYSVQVVAMIANW